jgi:hypothetical protein
MTIIGLPADRSRISGPEASRYPSLKRGRLEKSRHRAHLLFRHVSQIAFITSPRGLCLACRKTSNCLTI